MPQEIQAIDANPDVDGWGDMIDFQIINSNE